MTRRLRLALVILAALACIGCDQATKSLATSTLRDHHPRLFLSGVLELRYAENTGGFLSLGASLPAQVRYFAFVVVAAILLLVLVAIILRDSSGALVTLFAVACLIGGGVGNLIDRLAFGHVRDFAVLHVGAVSTGIFNGADVAVMLGCIMLMLGRRRGRSDDANRPR